MPSEIRQRSKTRIGNNLAWKDNEPPPLYAYLHVSGIARRIVYLPWNSTIATDGRSNGATPK
jgi:hypothetical protein